MSGNLPGESNAPQVQIPAIVFCVVVPAFVGIRFWSRIISSNSIGVDDWTIFVSLIFSLAVSITILIACNYGLGQHINNLTSNNRKIALQLFYVAQVFYKVNINMTKGSILLLYLRVFVQRVFRIICSTLLIIMMSYLIASTAVTICQCTPIARAWDESIPGTCINMTMNWHANTGFSVATDVIILLLPVPIIRSLRLQTSQVLCLAFILCLGGFVVVASSLRTMAIDFYSTNTDTTYDVISLLWTTIESNVAIICACLPCYMPLLHLLFPSIFPTIEPRSGPQGRNGNRGNLSKASSGKDTWVPPRGFQDVQLSSVHATRNTSEEHILDLMDGVKFEKLSPKNSIRKVTKFTIDYNAVGV